MHIAIVDDHKDTRDQIEGIVYQYYTTLQLFLIKDAAQGTFNV